MARFILSFCTALLLTACSTIIDRATQEMRVETIGAEGAMCYLERPGMKQKVYPPQTIRLTKTNDDITVRCFALGNREKTIIVEARMSATVMLNISNGFILGALYDYDTGALFKYPDIVRVDFSNTVVKAMPLPDYQKMLAENPMIMDMEEFRPGKSALQRDRYMETQILGKTERALAAEAGGNNGFSDTESSSEGEAAIVPQASSSSAEDLTRRMNPSVFGGGSEVGQGAAVPTGSMYGTSGHTVSSPVPLY